KSVCARCSIPPNLAGTCWRSRLFPLIHHGFVRTISPIVIQRSLRLPACPSGSVGPNHVAKIRSERLPKEKQETSWIIEPNERIQFSRHQFFPISPKIVEANDKCWRTSTPTCTALSQPAAKLTGFESGSMRTKLPFLRPRSILRRHGRLHAH